MVKGVRTLNLSFSEKQFSQLESKKKMSGKSWESFILEVTGINEDNNINKE